MPLKQLIISALLLAFASPAIAEGTPSPSGASAYIVNLKDGASVKSPFLIIFGLKGMGVAPAGTKKANTGHHHLIINEKIEGEELKENIPADEQHIHFGGGQTETTLNLKPGTYTLQLVLGDLNHVPHNPPVMSKAIKIIVK